MYAVDVDTSLVGLPLCIPALRAHMVGRFCSLNFLVKSRVDVTLCYTFIGFTLTELCTFLNEMVGKHYRFARSRALARPKVNYMLQICTHNRTINTLKESMRDRYILCLIQGNIGECIGRCYVYMRELGIGMNVDDCKDGVICIGTQILAEKV